MNRLQIIMHTFLVIHSLIFPGTLAVTGAVVRRAESLSRSVYVNSISLLLSF
jgi:hypothetical protein